jgi:hypothetical protein
LDYYTILMVIAYINSNIILYVKPTLTRIRPSPEKQQEQSLICSVLCLTRGTDKGIIINIKMKIDYKT